MSHENDRRSELPPAFRELRSELESRLADNPGGARRTSITRLSVAGAAAAAIVLFLALSPPGRAVADAVGELLGIGGEPSSPGFGGERAIVIGAGEGATESRFEIFATTNMAGSEREVTCLFVGFPDLPPGSGEAGGLCLTNALQRSLERTLFVDSLSPIFERPGTPRQRLILRVLARPEVSRLEMSYANGTGSSRTEIDVEGARLSDVSGNAIGVDDRASLFFGFLPVDLLDADPDHPRCLTQKSVERSLARIEIDAYGENGELIESTQANPRQAIQLLFVPPEGYRSWQGSRLDGGPPVAERAYCEVTEREG